VVGEPIAQVVQTLGDRIFHIHVDDNNGLRDQHLIPGDGNFDFASFIAALREVSYDGYLAAELSWDYTLDPDSAARITIQRLKDFLVQGCQGTLTILSVGE